MKAMNGFAVSVAVAAMCATAVAQGKDDFMRQQAYAEMQRVSGQVDVLQNNLGDLQNRVSKLESGGDAKGLRQEIDALKAELAALRHELQSQRGEIVKDLSGRLKDIQKSMTPPPPPPQPPKPAKPAYTGPCKEYVVESGDTLSLIASAFNTTVSKLKEMNNLKSDNLRIGQKLLVPKTKD
jgi:LysM repeat protein